MAYAVTNSKGRTYYLHARQTALTGVQPRNPGKSG